MSETQGCALHFRKRKIQAQNNRRPQIQRRTQAHKLQFHLDLLQTQSSP